VALRAALRVAGKSGEDTRAISVHSAARPRCGPARAAGNLVALKSKEIMTMTDLSELVVTLGDLRRKAAKRRDVAGYAANLEAIEARIAALEARRVVALATSTH